MKRIVYVYTCRASRCIMQMTCYSVHLASQLTDLWTDSRKAKRVETFQITGITKLASALMAKGETVSQKGPDLTSNGWSA